MSAQNDISRADFVVAQTLPGSGTNNPLGSDTSSQQSAWGTVITRPFSVQPLLGNNHVSVTVNIAGGTSPVGTLTLQVTDFAGAGDPVYADVFAANVPWVSTTGGGTVSVSGNGAYRLLLQNEAAKYVRLVYSYTSGTGGTVSAALTARASSRS
jgi:hypothetical protein